MHVGSGPIGERRPDKLMRRTGDANRQTGGDRAARHIEATGHHSRARHGSRGLIRERLVIRTACSDGIALHEDHRLHQRPDKRHGDQHREQAPDQPHGHTLTNGLLAVTVQEAILSGPSAVHGMLCRTWVDAEQADGG